MTHDEWAAALPRYAAGDLEEAEADGVRAHLATGCTSCLGVVFGLPVGHPLPARSSFAPGPRPVSPLVPAVVLLVLALAALVGWTVLDLREREGDRRAEVGRLGARVTDLEGARRAAVARLQATAADLDAARAEVTAAREAAAAALEARQELERTLAAAEERIGTLERGIRRRDAEIDRLLGPPEARGGPAADADERFRRARR